MTLVYVIWQYLEENIGALKIKLSEEELQEVRDIAQEADAAQGSRYPEAMMSVLFGDTPAL